MFLSPTCRGEAQRAHSDLRPEASGAHVTCAEASLVSVLVKAGDPGDPNPPYLCGHQAG